MAEAGRLEPGPRHAAPADDLGQPFSPADLRALADTARELVSTYDADGYWDRPRYDREIWIQQAAAVLREVAR